MTTSVRRCLCASLLTAACSFTASLSRFTGCTVGDVLHAVSLQYDALFPVVAGEPDHRSRGERRPFPASDVLRAIEREALIAAVAASTLGNGGQLSDDDRKRLILASGRITTAVMESRHA